MNNFQWLVANNKLAEFIDDLYYDGYIEGLESSVAVKRYNIPVKGKNYNQEQAQCVAEWLCAPHSEVDNDRV